MKTKNYRLSKWINLETEQEMFGVETRIRPGKWVSVAIGGLAIISPDRDRILRVIRWLNDPVGTMPEWDSSHPSDPS